MELVEQNDRDDVSVDWSLDEPRLGLKGPVSKALDRRPGLKGSGSKASV